MAVAREQDIACEGRLEHARRCERQRPDRAARRARSRSSGRHPRETSRHRRSVIPPDTSAAKTTPKPSAKPSRVSQRPSASSATPPGKWPGSAERVGSPTLNRKAPRAGWVSSPTTSHSTTYVPRWRASTARLRVAPATFTGPRATSRPSGPVTRIPSPTGVGRLGQPDVDPRAAARRAGSRAAACVSTSWGCAAALAGEQRARRPRRRSPLRSPHAGASAGIDSGSAHVGSIGSRSGSRDRRRAARAVPR